MSHDLPKVALVGRPNVGKSTLFNRLLGRRQAITASQAGTTRDRLEEKMEWKGRQFLLTDMAGLELQLDPTAELDNAAQQQVRIGLAEADLVIWVVDGLQEPQGVDYEIAKLLRSLHKPIVVAANKCDHPNHDLEAQEYASFGFTPLVTISAIHGRGTTELLEEISAFLPVVNRVEEKRHSVRVSVVGRPNVGKSTLINTLIEQERTVVSPIAGTTRDSVDVAVESSFKYYFPGWETVWLVDTAGVRRRGKIEQGIEQWSIIRTYEAIDSSDVVLVLLDGREGLVHQDMQVLQHVVDSGRALILVINKWDLVLRQEGAASQTPRDSELQDLYLERLLRQAPFLYWCPAIFTSAQEGYNVEALGQIVSEVFAAWMHKPTPAELAVVVEELRHNSRWKNLMEITCTHAAPPVFHLKVEGKTLPHFSSIRESENILRRELHIGPTPIKIWVDPSIQSNRRTGHAE